ncbi:MAG: DoxX family membrane protein, partial [Candidatus Tectomicrobia bacterium]|nr:DoxX family membrane protein [Candidatus Tectomicrobia bacterium]
FMPYVAIAHERFIKHEMLRPLQREFFRRLDPNMVNIALRVAFLMALMLVFWFLRDPLDNFVENNLLRKLRGKPKEWVHLLASFLTDKPIDHPWFKKIGEWVVVMFLRAPALVLMYSATNDSLVMPSYPLEPSTAAFFKYAQVIMAVGIITQTFLPFGGATILGTFIYLAYTFDWKIAVDILPILTVGAVYVSSPWMSQRALINDISKEQMRWVRLILGFGFFALGWMKLYNHNLTIGVADNYPSVLEDPLVKMFYIGTDPAFKRECWVVAFGMAEVLTGFMVMVGVFNRLWCAMMIYLFTKLMLVDFGWAEIPHLYPIGAFMAVTFSNHHSDEFYRIEEMEEYEERQGKTGLEILIAVIASIVIALIAIFPMLYFLTTVEHP